MVLLTNSTNYKVRTATLGKMGRWGIITQQTYMEGVLLESSNAETWTPLNGSDLAMKIYGYNFQSEGMIRFQPITGVQFSDINLDECKKARAQMNEERLQEISLRMQQPGFAVRCVQQDICALMAEVRRLQRELRIANEDLWFAQEAAKEPAGEDVCGK